ncbi:MAG: hypothetical protein J5J00_04375 [Deltaproteobacteria bacterium]|nr:hypothetical protein [Deltaproteobacteria bacterium]
MKKPRKLPKEMFLSMKSHVSALKADREQMLMVSPGLVLLLIGVGIIVAPTFFLGLIALLFISMGIVVAFVGWKLMQIKRKLQKMARDFEAKVYVHGVQVHRGVQETEIIDGSDSKKIILH